LRSVILHQLPCLGVDVDTSLLCTWVAEVVPWPARPPADAPSLSAFGQDMPRPFAKLKALDLDELAKEVAAGGGAAA